MLMFYIKDNKRLLSSFTISMWYCCLFCLLCKNLSIISWNKLM
ncbi:hypothetical protein A1OE_567 [Candidatus Endolissoclinum faulkneri L2]|uniref:Uncharacterized protein n=1 Tax=Candidatus Endolissoclinum faulkneri L2 TaxID=1193729 RepID=K7Z418_9PROT|nr:hypothetical protein A1OE_567 [Candidatus Endolissoclinum faulkneri L2]